MPTHASFPARTRLALAIWTLAMPPVIPMISSIPAAPAYDSSLSMLRQGYRFISNQCERLRSDAFKTRLMLREVVCMRGHAAAEQFYYPGRFTRRGAMPPTTFHLLQDEGSVQTLDGAAHRRRKEMFIGLMEPASLGRVETQFLEAWDEEFSRRAGETVVLHDLAATILTRAALRWCGLPADADEVAQRKKEMMLMIEGSGSIGPTLAKALYFRRRSEHWAAQIFRDVRSGRRVADARSPVAVIAHHRQDDNSLLSRDVAAVELINLIRPMVAIGRFIVFAALAMHEHPDWKGRLAEPAGKVEWSRHFANEVRRYYPFFPVIGGRVREPFEFLGHRFAASDWVLLDLYGTNHHPDLWDDPEAFRPERLADRELDQFSLVPQGGGEFIAGHRCPGEWMTVAITTAAVGRLASTDYAIPKQDITVPLNRFPTLPKSGFVMQLL
jgi:fatty-acid peroxygenase